MQRSHCCAYLKTRGKYFLCSSSHFSGSIIFYYRIIKEEIALNSVGYIQVHSYNSNAQIPLPDTSITVTDASGAAIAMRLTNRSGLLDNPIEISVPDLSASQSPDTGVLPFSTVDLYARLENYEEIYIKNLQVFPDTVSYQELEMIPLSEFPEDRNKSETFEITPQNL